MANRRWAGTDIGLRRMSLRFRDRGEENGFVRSCSAMLLDTTFSLAILALLGSLVFVVMHPQWTSDGIKNWDIVAGLPLKPIFYCCILSLTALTLTVAVAVKLPRVIGRVGLVARERVVSGVLMWMLLITVVCNPFYFMFLAGLNPYDVLHEHFDPVLSDAGTLMLLSVLITASHMALPVRWCTLIPLEVLAALVAVAMGAARLAVTPRDRDARESLLTVFLFLCTIVSAVIGKRQLEFANRLTFKTLLREKTQRCQAEFMLSQTTASSSSEARVPAGAGSQHGAGSQPEGSTSQHEPQPTTVSSGPVFAGMAEPGNLTMGKFLEMGTAEHWLLLEDEVTLSREILGRGSFGVVVAGGFCGSPAAVKIAVGQAKQSKVDAALANELRVVRRLRHPNIVLFHGTCVNPQTGDAVLVLARVYGKRLDYFVRGGDDIGLRASPPATEGDSLQVLIGVARSLLYLHTRQPHIVHGDLKPSNYVVEVHSSGPCPKLLDFGLARVLTRHAKPLGGTLRWQSPEAIARAPGKDTPHPAADMFSFGRLAFFICTGIEPLRRHDPSRIVKRAMAMVPEPLEWPAEPSALVLHCRRLSEECTRVDPAGRPSIGDAFSVLLQWQGGCAAGGHQAAESAAGPAPPGNAGSGLWKLVEQTRREQRQLDEKAERRGRRMASMEPQREPLPTLSEAGEGPCLVYPWRAETPSRSVINSLLDVLTSWNFRHPPSSCCPYHTALEIMRSHLEVLHTRGCPRRFLDTAPLQCPVCKLLCCDEGVDERDFYCRYCGFEAQGSSRNTIEV